MRMPDEIEYAPKGRIWPWSPVWTLKNVKVSGPKFDDDGAAFVVSADTPVMSRVGWRRWWKYYR